MAHTAVILPTLPVMLPLLAGIVMMLAHRWRRTQRVLSALALVANLAAALVLLMHTYGGRDSLTHQLLETRVLVTQVGNWPAPFGITIAIDTLAATLLAITGLVALCAYVFTVTQAAPRVTGGYFGALYQLLLLGVNWAFVTGDLFNLFVSFEIALLASYALLVIGTTVRQMRHAYKYVILNIFASILFAAACGWIYGTLGTLNLAELRHLSATGQVTGGAALAAAVLVFVFATKAAVLPMWFWLPDSYPTLPPGLGALYAALLTKVGVYAMLRVLVMCFAQADTVAVALRPALLAGAAGTMLLGSLGMVASNSLRRLLTCGILVGVGYMVLGLAYALHAPGLRPSSSADGVVGTVFYMAQHMLIISGLLLCADVTHRYARTDDLERMGGLMRRDLLLAVLFFVAAISLIGLPPTSGTFGKYLLLRASFTRADAWGTTLGILIVLTSILMLVALMRVWAHGFWSVPPADAPASLTRARWDGLARWTALVPLSLLVGVALAIGLFAQHFNDIATVAARGVIDPQAYVTAVLGPQAPRQAAPQAAPHATPAPPAAEGVAP